MSGLAAITLLILTALLEVATPALRSRRLPARRPDEDTEARLRRHFATESRRARRAAWLLRITLLAALSACVLLAPVGNRLIVALIVVAGLALLHAGSGVLRRPGIASKIAARVMLWPLSPYFWLLPSARSGQHAAPRDPDETIADIADALAS